VARGAFSRSVLLLALIPAALAAGEGLARESVMSLAITSTAFAHGAAIPEMYTCDGDNVAPPLSFGGVPKGTKALALLMDDPDAPVGDWVHWIVLDMPPSCAGLDEDGEPPAGARQGRNSWGRVGWGGPCPPSGKHRYFFRLFALDAPTGLPEGATKQQLLTALEGHVLATAELMGTYAR